jgi:hypothetical protein
MRRRFRNEHESLVAALLRRKPPLWRAPLLRDWYWAIAMVRSRAFGGPCSIFGVFVPGKSLLSTVTVLAPLVDCMNHAPDPKHAAAGEAVVNAQYEYARDGPAGTSKWSELWSELWQRDQMAKLQKCKVVTLLQPLLAGDEVLLSYTGTGSLSAAQDAQVMLTSYGYIPDALGAAPYADYFMELSKHTARTRKRLARRAALDVHTPLAVTVHAQCAKHALHAAREVAAVRLACNEPARLAALYRRCRALGLACAFMAAVPRDDAVQAAVAAGVAHGVRDAVAQGCFADAPAGAADAFIAGVRDIILKGKRVAAARQR